jgi:Family of unknown function (DUF6169)
VKRAFQDIMSIQQPYKFILREDQYFFETENGIKYRVEIKDGSSYFIDFKPYLSVFELSIDLDSDLVNSLAPYDARTELTIIQILMDFFKEHSNCIIYVCDSADGRHHARNRKFNSWFNRYNDGSIEKYDINFEVEDSEMLFSLILHHNNPFKEEIIKLFYQQPKLYGK